MWIGGCIRKEAMWNVFSKKLKTNYRRIATRYDKLAKRFLGFVHLACILIWLK
jgi:transposase